MLTDNEKAATYIGWVPNTPCTERHVEWFTRCPCGSDAEPEQPHNKACPVMNWPENYMRAFEEASEPSLFWDLGYWYCHLYTGTVPNRYKIVGTGNTVSEAVFSALVILYNEEHR